MPEKLTPAQILHLSEIIEYRIDELIDTLSSENSRSQNQGIMDILRIDIDIRDSLEKMIRFVEKELISTTSYSPGQKIVLICGFPVGMMRSTNLALIHTIGSLDSA